MQLTDDKYRTAAMAMANSGRPTMRYIWQRAADKNVVRDIYYQIMCLNTPRITKYDDTTLAATIRVLEWLANHSRVLGAMKVCANPNCKTDKRFFWRKYPNHKYCGCLLVDALGGHNCEAEAKELRREQRAIGQTPKRYKRSKLARQRMSDAAYKRWAKELGKAT